MVIGYPRLRFEVHRLTPKSHRMTIRPCLSGVEFNSILDRLSGEVIFVLRRVKQYTLTYAYSLNSLLLYNVHVQ